MLLRPVLLHLLRTRPKLIWATVATHWHLSGWLLCVHWRDILGSWAHARSHARSHTRSHSVHWLLMTLLRTLIDHHRGASPWAWETILSRHDRRLTVMWWHKRALASLLIHHRWSRWHTLGSQERRARVRHHDRTHLSLLRKELILGECAKLRLHLWRSWVRHHLRIECELCVLIHRRWICEWDVLQSWRCIGLG